MYRRFVVLCLVTAGILGMQAPTVTHAQGNSDAAHACQQGGYLNLQGSDGTTFKNAGQCVSYVAHGGTIQGLTGCLVSSTSGCVTLNGLSIVNAGDKGLGTITLTGAYSFSPLSRCGHYADDGAPCGPATGGGTYTVTGGTLNEGTSGTFTVSGTTGALFSDTASTDATCPLAVVQRIVLVAATFTDSASGQPTTFYLAVTTGAPNQAELFDTSFNEVYFQDYGDSINATINC